MNREPNPPVWVPPPFAAYGDILRAAAHVCDVAERERLARLARMPIADIKAWAARHDIQGSDGTLREIFEDARTLNPAKDQP